MSLVFVWFFSQQWTNRDYGSALMEEWEIAQCTSLHLWSFLFYFIKISERSSKRPILRFFSDFVVFNRIPILSSSNCPT